MTLKTEQSLVEARSLTHWASRMFSVAQSTDLLWPQWQEGQHVLKKRILMPELCLVYFRVEVTRGARASRKTSVYGQNCIPLISLLPGTYVAMSYTHRYHFFFCLRLKYFTVRNYYAVCISIGSFTYSMRMHIRPRTDPFCLLGKTI